MVQPTEFPAYLKIEAKSEGAFPQLEMDIAKMGENMKRGIGRNLQEIEQMISSAMSRPRNISGALDLGSAEIRAAAEASLARAAAAKEMATATMQAAKQQGELTQESLRSIAALEALERKERDAAAAANAQADAIDRVQQALDRQTTSVNALQYAEQARAGRVEVQQRNRQAGLNEVFAPGLTRRAVDNGAGFSALEGLARQQAEAEQAAAAMLRLQQAEVGAAEGARILEAALKGTALEAGRTTKSARDSAAAFEAVFQAQERAAAEMLALQRAEAGAAEGARILAAALQGTALASDRTTKSARESAAVFEQAFAAQERAAREAAAAQQVLAASAAQLRAELDPMFAAQQRFNTALDRAEELLKAGAITTREYEQAQAQARQQLQAHAQALFQVETAQGRGTTATRINTESQRANRFAMIQAGQQLQDITVSLQSGQRATTVFAQQLPQLAFAFTDVGGKVGAFAQFLAGPWGVAVFAGVTALGFLMEHLSRTSDRLDETASAAEKSAGRIRSALENLQAYGQTASEMSRLFTDSTDVRIKAAEKDAKAARLELDAQQAREEANRKGIGIDREYRQAALRRAESAETRAKALRSEANADRATADATLRAAAQKERAQAVLDGMNGTATGSTRRGGGATIDREARAAAKEIDQLESKIQSLESRLDPATSAAREFADALEAINAAAARGVISPGRAQELSTAAIFEDDRRQKAAEAADVGRFLQIYRPIDLDGLVESSEAYSRRIAEKWKDSQRDAAREFASALQSVDIARSLASGRGIAGIGRGLASGQLNLGNPEFQDAFSKAFKDGVKGIEEAFSGALKDVLGPDSAKVGEALGKGFLGAQIGGMTSDLLEGIGLQNSKLGSQIGGAIGSAFGPIGSLIGSVIGGVGIEALKPAKRGSATIGGSGTNLIVASSRGNSSQRVKASVQTADEAITTLERIAEALGGRIDASRGSVSIGVRGDSFRVDTSGRGITKTKKGAVDFGDDSAAAIRFATLDLIQDGVVQGIRASTQRILQSGKDLESAIQKAVDFQSVFDRLQERVDPVGAAITRVEKEFTRLRQIFGEAAASAEEYADLEKLYQLERQDAIKEANERVLGSMKALLDDLRFGDNGRSLRDRLAAAQAKFDPLAARVQAGDITAYDDFAEAARALLDIQRQFSGSQTAFFELQDKITAITAKVVEGGNVTSILSGSTPTAQQQAQQAYDGSNVVNAIDRQTQELARILTQVVGGTLVAINDNVAGGPITGGRTAIPGFFAQQIPQI